MTLDEAIKHCEEVAEENQAIVDSCDYYGENMAKCEECAKEHRQLAAWLRELKQLREQMSHSEKPNKWIPLTKRPMTDKEREEHEKWIGLTESMVFCCPIPKDGQEVLISYGDYVTITTFYKDGDGVCYFDIGDINKVNAWMPLPLPYKAERDDESCDEIWEKAYAERNGKK